MYYKAGHICSCRGLVKSRIYNLGEFVQIKRSGQK